jgi:hypothetical protein
MAKDKTSIPLKPLMLTEKEVASLAWSASCLVVGTNREVCGKNWLGGLKETLCRS